MLDVKQKWGSTQLGISNSRMPAVLRFVFQYVLTLLLFSCFFLFNVPTGLFTRQSSLLCWIFPVRPSTPTSLFERRYRRHVFIHSVFCWDIQLRFYFVDWLLVSTVCPNMEVRNGPQQFSELEGCRVAELKSWWWNCSPDTLHGCTPSLVKIQWKIQAIARPPGHYLVRNRFHCLPQNFFPLAMLNLFIISVVVRAHFIRRRQWARLNRVRIAVCVCRLNRVFSPCIFYAPPRMQCFHF